MKNTLIALILTAGLPSSALLAMRTDGESQKGKSKPASFTVNPEFQPGELCKSNHETLWREDEIRWFEDDTRNTDGSSVKIVPSSNSPQSCEHNLDALANALTQEDLYLYLFEENGVCNSASDQGIPKIIHDLDSHAHFFESTLPPLPYFLPMENRRTFAAEIITALKSSKDDTAKPYRYSDLGQEKCVDTVRAAIKKDMQENAETPIMHTISQGAVMKLSSSKMPKIEEVD